MRIFDISQEVFSCAVYPGDPKPERQTVCSTATGDLYNLTAFAMCAHNGTHVDAPFHFLHDGKTVDQMDLSSFVGDCYVARHEGKAAGRQSNSAFRVHSGERGRVVGVRDLLYKSGQ